MGDETDKSHQLESLLEQIKDAAQEYYKLTGRPLGVTGEMGEYWAAKLFGLKLEVVRFPGYDAIESITGKTVQVKARVVQKSTNYSRETIGEFKLKQPWDTAMVVVLKKDFDPIAIYEASKTNVIEALSRPGSNARARGVLSIGEFRRYAKAEQIWPKLQRDAQIG